MKHRPALAVLVALTLVLGACGDDDTGTDATTGGASAGELVGVLRVDAGTCSDEGATGSYFRMVQPGGTLDAGPFVVNGDSSCADKTWTVLQPGTDGGLRIGGFQPQPAEPFDAGGNSTSARIVAPQKWFAVAFGLATNEKDPQTGAATSRPAISVDGGALTGDLSALAASWNGQHFNQGAPKPGGERPGNTGGPRGTYDAETGAYTLEWSSQIIGGPFNNFTGVWHIVGTFEPAA